MRSSVPAFWGNSQARWVPPCFPAFQAGRQVDRPRVGGSPPTPTRTPRPSSPPALPGALVRWGVGAASAHGCVFYWRSRRSVIDTGRMVSEDLLPLLRSKGLATDRIGLIGWSMGGYGALLMAARLGPTRVAGVVAASAALWQSPADSAPGAFDDREDFVRNDVFAARGKLRGVPVRLDCGRDDPFVVANRAFVRELPGATVTFDAGAHTEEYWTAHAGAQMSWLAKRFQQ